MSEHTCLSSKMDKTMNVYNSHGNTKGIMGWRMNLILIGSITNDFGQIEDVELL